MNRRNFNRAMASALLLGSWTARANAAAKYPEKPIRVILSTSAGGATDSVARLYSEYVGQSLNQSLVIENMPGALTLISVRNLVKAPPDGYTVGIMANTITTLPYLPQSTGFKSSEVTGISNLAQSSMIFVVSSASPYQTLDEFVAAAKKNPGGLAYASVGEGTTSHLSVELFTRQAGINLLLVLYKGISTAVPDVLAGRVTAMMGTMPTVGQLIKAGKLRALAVTSPRRLDTHPDVPTFAELGYGDAIYELFLGLFAPAKTPASVIQSLSDAFESAKKQPELVNRLHAMDQELPAQTTPAQFNAFLAKEEARMKPLLARKS